MSKKTYEELVENYIDKNIAELAMEYDKIRGANVNIARINGGLIDGLKPVQRRALYIMYLKDKGKKFVKLARISGDTFGRVHPHCVAPNTKFILADGSVMNIGDLYDLGTDDSVFDIVTYDPKLKDTRLAKMHHLRVTMYTSSWVTISFANGGKVTCTKDHKWLTSVRDGVLYSTPVFVEAKDLKINDILYSGVHSDNIQARITSVQFFNVPAQRMPMMDFTVDGTENAMISIADPNDLENGTVAFTHNSPVSIDNAIVGLEQEWKNTIPLIDGGGNFGSVDGSPAGASRYIMAKLSEYSQDCFFTDWEHSVVDMTLGSDEETMEPVYLPAKYPNALLNGCLGIGYGTASNIPPYNFKELIDACIKLMHNPDSKIVLIPDSPTGASIIENDFARITATGLGSYSMRCTYDIDAENNIITITSLPYNVPVNDITKRIAEIKDKGGLSQLIDMNDHTKINVNLQLVLRDDVNPYKFMKKLIKEVSGLEKTYPVNITVSHDYEQLDLSVTQLLLEWIAWRREYTRLVTNHKRTNLMADQRTNDVKIFLMDKDHLQEVQDIFRRGRKREDIEKELIARYRDSEIRMDTLQARTLSNMRMIELSIDAYEACLKKRDELTKELNEIEEILADENGVDKLIISDFRDGVKKFGKPRRSNVVPYKISSETDIQGVCILQLSSDGYITRKVATNVDAEAVPIDSNGFAVVVDNDSSFILIDETAHSSFIRVNDIPVDVEVPANRYCKQNITGNIVAMMPSDDDTDLCCTLISKSGQLKRVRVNDIGASKKACINLTPGDKLVKGIITRLKSVKDILVYTKEGMGQRFDPNMIRVTSPMAKGSNGFKLRNGDEIVGCYAINPDENQYLFYMTAKGKARLNAMDYLPMRDSKHDAMVKLISLNDRDRLVAVIGCNKRDKAQVYFDDGTNEIIEINSIEESTMSSDPKKITSKNAVTTNVVKVKIV